MALSQARKSLVEKAKSVGNSDQAVALSIEDCAYLLVTVACDLKCLEVFPEAPAPPPGIFESSPARPPKVACDDLHEWAERLFERHHDADTYFACLASLHKARLKSRRILETQPVPTVDQIGPRGLLQYGELPAVAVANLVIWRKWIYDIDNRAAQETGYLFEPILASAIGGVSVSARKSPVKRRRDSKKGRQVDCLSGGRAYEFKIRVTIAASGQGRWAEEMSFPADCKHSGYTPILVVLDATPNPKLRELTKAFHAAGGEAYVGHEAWAHLEAEAGPAMSVFIEKYVREPLISFLASDSVALPSFSVSFEDGKLIFTVGEHVLTIDRFDSAEPEDPDPIPEDADDLALGP